MPYSPHPSRAAVSTALCGAVIGLAALAPRPSPPPPPRAPFPPAFGGAATGRAPLAPAAGAEPRPAGGPPALAKLAEDTARLPDGARRTRALQLVRSAQAEAEENPC